ncbi:hypothetical protein JTB14_034455 [Gonioctena quinquepunctata]|nr:hypothetical protein JTB14_034455 [Gonioctena quinquepunctata]
MGISGSGSVDMEISHFFISSVFLYRTASQESVIASLASRVHHEEAIYHCTPRSSRKAWGLLRRLGEANRGQHSNNPTNNPNKIASRIVEVSRAPSDETHTVSTKKP